MKALTYLQNNKSLIAQLWCGMISDPFQTHDFNHYWRDLQFDIFEKGVVREKAVTA